MTHSSVITSVQIRAIKTLQGRIALDDETYRGLLARETGKTSSTKLSKAEAIRVIDRLQRLAGGPSRSPAGTATGKFAPVLKALWLDGYHLGVVHNRDDKALIAFVQRQTGVSHTRFLTDGADAAPAIEALKAWLTRAAGVKWPASRDPAGIKVAVVAAQIRRLAQLAANGAPVPLGRAGAALLHRDPATLALDDLDAVQRRLGKMLRQALTAQSTET